MITKIDLLRLMVILELMLLIITVVGSIILLYIIKASSVERLIRMFSFRQIRSITEIKERLLKNLAKLKSIKVEIFVASGFGVTSLLCFWYLIKKNYVTISLPSEFFLLGILIITPFPFLVLYLEYYFKKIIEKIDKLQERGDIK